MGIIQRAYEERGKVYNLTFSSKNLSDIKKEFDRIIKNFKKNTNFDKITFKIVIKFHENDDIL